MQRPWFHSLQGSPDSSRIPALEIDACLGVIARTSDSSVLSLSCILGSDEPWRAHSFSVCVVVRHSSQRVVDFASPVKRVVQRSINLRPPCVPGQRCLSTEGRVVPHPCQPRKILACSYNHNHVCHQFRDKCRIRCCPDTHICAVALEPCKNVRNLPVPSGLRVRFLALVLSCVRPELWQELAHITKIALTNSCSPFEGSERLALAAGNKLASEAVTKIPGGIEWSASPPAGDETDLGPSAMTGIPTKDSTGGIEPMPVNSRVAGLDTLLLTLTRNPPFVLNAPCPFDRT